jgi:hypothetical protein
MPIHLAARCVHGSLPFTSIEGLIEDSLGSVSCWCEDTCGADHLSICLNISCGRSCIPFFLLAPPAGDGQLSGIAEPLHAAAEPGCRQASHRIWRVRQGTACSRSRFHDRKSVRCTLLTKSQRVAVALQALVSNETAVPIAPCMLDGCCCWQLLCSMLVHASKLNRVHQLQLLSGMGTACARGGGTSWSASRDYISWGCCQRPSWR